MKLQNIKVKEKLLKEANEKNKSPTKTENWFVNNNNGSQGGKVKQYP